MPGGGGRLTAASRRRYDAVFRLVLPSPRAGLRMKEATSGQSIVFVIDDDASLGASVSSLLRSVGLQARVFASTSEFLQEKRPNVPSCMVLDVRLPGVSGIDFQADLSKRNIHIPIVFMTGHGDIPMTVRAMKAGAVEFLTKPFRDQDLLDAVQLALERDRKGREQRAEIAE